MARMGDRLDAAGRRSDVDRGDHLAPVVADRVLDGAAVLQPEAERVIKACAVPGDVAADIAQRGMAAIAGYGKPSREPPGALTSPAAQSLKERTRSLFRYHEWMVREALDLACDPAQTERVVDARTRMDGLGTPAAVLRGLRHELSEELALLTPQDDLR